MKKQENKAENQPAVREEGGQVCPFCGQVVMTGDDPREYCDCDPAIRFRAITDAVEDFCGPECKRECEEFDVMDREVIGALTSLADSIARRLFFGAKVVLPDGSSLSIGAKVSRSLSVKAEKVVQ
jgi:hypothetical protein